MKEFWHVDARGSLVNMTDGYGRVSMRADYDDWGDLQHSDSITINGGFRQLYLLDNYTGHEYDQVLDRKSTFVCYIHAMPVHQTKAVCLLRRNGPI